MKDKGFSLLELSIVLVIIGLIAGGIVAGSSMIRAAELRAVITEFTQYQTSAHTFRDKYLGLPGDLKNATAFWGAAHATPATCLTTVGTGTQTCDGNGDGWIIEPVAASQRGESLMFWQHLANAELINGTYTGMAGSGNQFHANIGESLPESKLAGSGWSSFKATSYNPYLGDAYWFAINYGHFFSLGTQRTNHWSWGENMSAEEVWNVDKKLDDGKPGQGNVIVGFYEPCTDRTAGQNTPADALAAEYDLTNKDIACNTIFRNVF